MQGKKIIIVVILVLLVLVAFFGAQYVVAKNNVAKLQQQVKTRQLNVKIVDFTKLFINVVLKNKTEGSFDERLKLEIAVGALGDKAILDQWEKFIASTSEVQAQQEVANLLNVLVNKLAY